ncbi:LpqN/LpqT family lipoprotein [Sanguibacter suarezii]|uniref:LpqN/LpqT family lipoprotein n=1 Tax=Sanguibacter suarezii TaxID=60921 RepID=UPI0008369B1F|nr:LpqN/LpqT family lipoprotein [Sanguibacter suarezii]
MGDVLTFPSDAFPAYPSLQVAQPQGWVGLAGVGLPLALAQEVPAGQFRPNVLVTVTRFGADFTVAAARKDVAKRLKALPRFTETLREDAAEMLGVSGLRVEGYFSDGKGGTLVQALRMCVLPAGPVFDVVQITGTCAGTQVDSAFAQIREIQDSLILI